MEKIIQKLLIHNYGTIFFIFIAPKYVNFFHLRYKSFLKYYAAAANPVAKNNL